MSEATRRAAEMLRCFRDATWYPANKKLDEVIALCEAEDGPDYRSLWLAALPLMRAASKMFNALRSPAGEDKRDPFAGLRAVGRAQDALVEAYRALPAEARAEIEREG